MDKNAKRLGIDPSNRESRQLIVNTATWILSDKDKMAYKRHLGNLMQIWQKFLQEPAYPIDVSYHLLESKANPDKDKYLNRLNRLGISDSGRRDFYGQVHQFMKDSFPALWASVPAKDQVEYEDAGTVRTYLATLTK